MNNIYKVIWSKAKNCYVVASEIARSHTKSATGSEKIGGVTRRSLLASLMALSLLCGGLGVASAANSTVHVYEFASGAAEVYTKTGVDTLLADYGKKEDVQTNKDDITALQNTTTTQGNQITANTTQIANNTADIEKKIDKEIAEAKLALKANVTDVYSKTDADARYATRMELDAKADKTALDGKADRTYVDQKLTEAGTNVDNKLADYYNKAAVDGKITAEENARNNAITTAIEQERNDRDAAITTAINGEVANRNQAINTAITQEVTARDLAVTNAKTELQGKITKEETARKEADTAFNTRLTTAEGKIGANETAIGDLKAADTALEGEITKNREDIATLNGKVATAEGNITDLKAKDTDLEKKIQINADNIQANSNAIATTDKRTAGIARNDATSETTIEKNVTVDNKGNVTAEGQLTGKGVDAGAGDITTEGAVNAGSLNVTGASHLVGDVTMDQKLSVTGDTSLKKTDVDGALTAKGDVILGTNKANMVTVNGKADFNEAVNMDNGLTVDKGLTVTGDTNLENTTVDGNLKVTGTITTDKMVFGDKATNNYTEIDKGHITSKNDVLAGDATKKKSSMELDHSKLEVAVTDKDSNGHLTMTADKTSIKNSDLDEKNYSEIVADKDSVRTTVKDEKDNTTSTKSSATEIRNYAGDAAGNKTNNVQTATQNKSWAKDKDGNESSIVQTGKDITNTAQNGTITNDANHIENTANTMNTTVSGQATESYGKLDTTVNGAENHTVNGQQTNTVGDGQINNITGGQKNNILTGNQETKVSNGSIINKAENGDISNTAKNVTNVGTESVTNTVGGNEVKVSKDGVDIKAEAGKKITESVGTDTSRTMTDGRIIDKAGDMTVTTDKTTGTTFENGTPNDTTVINGGTIGTNKVNAKETNTKKLTAGADDGANGGRLTVDANDGVKGSYKYGDYTSRSYILANTLQSGVDNGKDITDNGFVGSRTDHYMDGDKAKLNETVKDADGSNVTKKTSTKTYTEIKDTNGNTLSVNQKADGNNYKLEDQDGNTNHVTNSATQSKQTLKDKDGNTLTTNQTATKNNFDLKSADGSKENHTTNTVDESRVAIKGENGKAELSTTDEGTTFKHSAAKEAFTEGGATNTTIKGNTITTGKVTMDYADVMKDLGVKGNTTLGEAGKDTTLTVNSKATFNNGLTVTNGETKLKNTTIEGTLNVFENATFQKDVTANSFSVNGKTYIDSDGLNANNQVIRNVADGSISEGSKDAVNGGQLYNVKNDLEGKVNKVGANAAAMANLHPMEFDPDSKWNIAAAIGNYGSETAAALGAFYRPNDDVMVNLSTAFGTGENMVGGGVSVRLGKGGNKLSREESNALKDQVNDLTARMDALLSVLNPNMSKDFPDVPENHWAYEAVSRLAGNDIVQGYPDGEFHGERTMTRYEMAEIIYNALSRGAEAEKELVEEFKPELQAMAASEKATAEKAEG